MGSAGVGKSCFIMLVSLYLAFVEKKKVFVVRRLRGFSEASAVVYLDGGNASCIRKANLTAAKIASLPDRKEFQDALVLVDGYSRKEVDRQFGLLPFQVLASSTEDEINFDGSACEVVLPGWQYSDLLQYAELKPEDGGSIRNFRKHREDVKNGIDGICGLAKNAQTVDIESVHQAGSQVSDSFGRVRRYYVVDPNDEVHYWQVCNWRLQVDSGYAFKRIGRFMDWDIHFGHYEFAQQARTGFWGAAYEQCFHGAVRQATKWYPVQMVNVVVNFDPTYSNQKYDRIELRGQSIQYEGRTEDECYRYLSKLSTGTYWRPECVDFPFVDAVVVCEATLRGSGMKEKIVACISTTVGDKKVFQPDIWRKLNKALDKSGSISTSDPRVFVVVGPGASTCKRVTLVDAPSPDEFMVCCFDPLKLPRKPALPF
ncbi:hypothetical protein PF004_g4270 [Phytophthora fragariae]|uniref:Uncharacterized protein n=2 Tax=Phytophthora fragariae TaxID=53985 RepID=A0A6G0PIZ6_9STRA|nr:hypothetical protein PF004_g4270 [Phytophthora fragariae]